MSAAKVIAAVLGLIGLCLIFAWMVRQERTGRRHRIVMIIAVRILLEAFLYPDQGDVTSNLFYPAVGHQNFRLPEILIPIALLARWQVVGRINFRLWGPGVAWGVFMAYYTGLFVVSVVQGNPSTQALFDAKSVIYVGGGYLLVAGCDLERFTSARFVKVSIISLGTVTPVLALLSLTNTNLTFSLPPLMKDAGFTITADYSAVMAAYVCCLLGVELCRRPRPRRTLIVVALITLVCPVAGTQRASIVEAAAGAATLVILALVSGRSSIRGSDNTLIGTGLVAAALGYVGFRLITGGPINPVQSRLQYTFESLGKQQSASDRVFLRHAAIKLIEQKPILGWGLGKQPLLVPADGETPIYTPSHNLALDLLIRGGVVDLLLFLVAIGLFIGKSIQVIRRSASYAAVGLLVGAIGALVGLLAKGAVESDFDQFRVATTFGFVLGLMAMAIRSTDAELQAQDRERYRVGPANPRAGSRPDPTALPTAIGAAR